MTISVFGSKFPQTAHVDVAEVAALIRADICQAVVSGAIPACTYTVSAGRCAGSDSIDVHVRRALFPVYEAIEAHNRRAQFTTRAHDLAETLQALVDAYNSDASGDVRFYGHVDFDGATAFVTESATPRAVVAA